MGVLYDYFTAPSDEAAAATVDRTGGPGRPVGRPRGLFRRRTRQDAAPTYPTLADTGIDPAVQLSTLHALLSGLDPDALAPEEVLLPVDVLAERDGGERLVIRVDAAAVDALTGASDDRLAQVAVPWSRTEEFWGGGDPDELTPLLHHLAALARNGRGRGEGLYCWVAV
jgi:hypothetical protein